MQDKKKTKISIWPCGECGSKKYPIVNQCEKCGCGLCKKCVEKHKNNC